MKALYPDALWRPLGDPRDEPLIVPRLLIVHTIVGGLAGTEQHFKASNGRGYAGTESHFGLGGPSDGPALDGRLYQWQRCDRQADAQYDANVYAISVETSDGGDPSRPWSPRQIDTLVELCVWFHQESGAPLALATSPVGRGLGYHRMFREWNRARHSCPGDVRAAQFEQIVVPHARRLAANPTGAAKAVVTDPRRAPASKPVAPTFPFPPGHYIGVESRSRLCHSGATSSTDRSKIVVFERQMRARGWRGFVVDGVYRAPERDLVRRFQAEKKLQVDGKVGPQTWRAAWTARVT